MEKKEVNNNVMVKEGFNFDEVNKEINKPEYWEKAKERDIMNEPELRKSKVRTLSQKLSQIGVPKNITNNMFNGMKRSRLQYDLFMVNKQKNSGVNKAVSRRNQTNMSKPVSVREHTRKGTSTVRKHTRNKAKRY